MAEKLPEDFRAHHPTIDWAGLMRLNRLTARLDDRGSEDLTWRALSVRVPGLPSALGRQIA